MLSMNPAKKDIRESKMIKLGSIESVSPPLHDLRANVGSHKPLYLFYIINALPTQPIIFMTVFYCF